MIPHAVAGLAANFAFFPPTGMRDDPAPYNLVRKHAMSDPARHDDEQFQLWRRYLARSDGGPAPPDLDANLLASYLDGTADPEEIEQVEARLADDPESLEEVRELRLLTTRLDIEPAPPSLFSRAKALVPPGDSAPTRAPRRVLSLDRRPWWQRLQWMAAAAVVVVAALGGYSFGRETYHDQSRADQLTAASASLLIEEIVADQTLQVGNGNGENGGAQ